MRAHSTSLDPDIAGLTADSRAVKPGYLFAALPGSQSDGRDFITDALARGAAAILAPTGTDLPPQANEIPVIDVDNPRRSLSLFAGRYFGSQPRIAAAVTGTNGKTSVAWFTHHIWKRLGYRAAAVGTLGVTTAETDSGRGAGLTTADPVTLHRELKALADDGVGHIVLEASSHGLEQSRLDGVHLAAGAFTNLSRDHLDHHGTMDNYRAAKLRLFDSVLPDDATAVLNADSDDFPIFSSIARARGLRIIGYGRAAAEIRIERIEAKPDGQLLSIKVLDKHYEVDLALPGVFQARNALCALGLAIACGDDVDDVIALLPELESPPGRLELIGHTPNGAPIYVDYAHTPDALGTLLAALRPHTAGKLSIVFGCGGDRDRGKRPQMGAIARDLADRIYITDDNPRSEDATTIRSEIIASCPDAAEISDRAEAIHQAASDLAPNDVLVIAGKGHETGQIIGDQILPFEDGAITRAVIDSMGDRDR
ncbi:MAG: UDP-N-acetylmuramoyl-L-alanyl-D-glutamate--2,6-diaminopimelate ligase [Alphaproteobacteria bacterium]|nr:UDP-N-acetylmuramoyl-L-alanyl-D-glutamate--2,6-diaminopimelate ligase [Alphaproteobacteria bacterium]